MSAKNTIAVLLISGALLPGVAMAESEHPHPYVGMWVVDDTGFTADGEFINDVLYHGGMVLRRQNRTTDEQ